MCNLKSVFRGILAMTRNHAKVNYGIHFHRPFKPGVEAWTPVWHEGRGPYISIGLFVVSFYRGY